jgi:hypothetical protein
MKRVIVKRKIRSSVNNIEIINEMWECPACIKESNSVEWFWEGKPSENGYVSRTFCPCCGHFEEQ